VTQGCAGLARDGGEPAQGRAGGPEQLDAALPVASLDKIALKKELDAIGQHPD
jgi:hypothetical protein